MSCENEITRTKVQAKRLQELTNTVLSCWRDSIQSQQKQYTNKNINRNFPFKEKKKSFHSYDFFFAQF